MSDYKRLLDKNFKEQAEMGIELDSKMEYLGNIIFNFTTYDGSADFWFASKMIPVLDCILNKTTFNYIHYEEQYLNYLLMVNSPFQ